MNIFDIMQYKSILVVQFMNGYVKDLGCFNFSCENECDLKFESLNMETILEAADEVKDSLNNSCYVGRRCCFAPHALNPTFVTHDILTVCNV